MFATVVLLVAIGVSAPEPTDASKKSLDSLQGTWKAVSGEEKGRAIDVKDESDQVIIKIAGTSLLLQHGADSKPEQYVIELDPKKEPAEINLSETLGGRTAGRCPAIYKLEKGRLTLCVPNQFFATKAEDRPKEFSTGSAEDRPRKGQLLFVFEKMIEK